MSLHPEALAQARSDVRRLTDQTLQELFRQHRDQKRINMYVNRVEEFSIQDATVWVKIILESLLARRYEATIGYTNNRPVVVVTIPKP